MVGLILYSLVGNLSECLFKLGLMHGLILGLCCCGVVPDGWVWC